MPIDRAGVLKAPINRNPPRPPLLEANVLRARGVAADVEDIEVLPRKNVPVAVEERAPQMLRQGFQRPAVFRVVGVNGVVIDARANKFVVARIIQVRTLEACRRLLIDPQRLYPGVSHIAGVRRACHAREDSLPRIFTVGINLCRTAVARSEELPLLQRKVCELVDPDEQELRALILIDITFKARSTCSSGSTSSHTLR